MSDPNYVPEFTEPQPHTVVEHMPPQRTPDSPVMLGRAGPPPIPKDAKRAGRRIPVALILAAAGLFAVATFAYQQEMASGRLSCLVADNETSDAYDVCRVMEERGAVTRCRTAEVGGLGARASHKADFDIPTGQTGQILSFATCDSLDKTVRDFDATTFLTGRHQYQSRHLRLFIQLNEHTPEAAAREIIAAAFAR